MTESEAPKSSKKKFEGRHIDFWLIFFGLILLRLWLITGIPKMIIFGPHDDLFFPKAAHSILRGHWMGNYDHFTLIKGPFYAFFLTGSFLSGLPLYLTETIFYIGACLVLFFALKPLIPNPWVRLVGFTGILYIPSSFPTWFHLRVYREFVYFSLTLYVTGFAIGLFLRAAQKLKYLFFWSVGLGLSMGAFMLTREEGVWIYPIMLLLLLVGVLVVIFGNEKKKFWKSALFALPIGIWYLPILIVSWLNYSNYGFWGVTEQLDRDFNRVLNSLARIESEQENWHPAIQISHKDRIAAYEISPTLAAFSETIEAYVESYNPADNGSMSLKPNWYLEQYGNTGGELSNGHFPWLLRDVIAHNGYYRYGHYPREIYQKIADEIEQACQEGEISCRDKSILPGVISAIDQRHLPIIFRMLKENVIDLTSHRDVEIQSMRISEAWPEFLGGEDDRLVFEQFAYNPIDPIQAVSDEEIPTVIYGVTDLRYRVIQYKEIIMELILKIYQGISQPIFFLSIVLWPVLIILKLTKYEMRNWLMYFASATFTFGLFFTRLTTLTILDATSSIPGIKYGASIHLFVWLFPFLIIIWTINQIRIFLGSRKKV